MTIFMIKSLLSLLMLAPASYGMYTMFEYSVKRRRLSVRRCSRNAISFPAGSLFLLFVIISYLCISFLAASKAEPSSRAAIHILLALALIVLLIIKVLFVRVYRQFYSMTRQSVSVWVFCVRAC